MSVEFNIEADFEKTAFLLQDNNLATLKSQRGELMTTIRTISEIAEGFGLTLETAILPNHDKAFRVYKGVNQIFIGTESAVREFLSGYEKERPGLYEGSMYAYKE